MGEIRRFVSKAQRIGKEQLKHIEEQIELIPEEMLPEHARRDMRRAVFQYARDPNESVWPGGFSMLSLIQTAAIWDAIRALPADDRPGHVRHAFDLAMLNLRQDTGEIMLTRDQIAEKIGCSADHVSRVMGTLETMGVIRRERRKIPGMQGPGVAVYFVNPHVAWNGSLEIRKQEAARHTPPLLRLMEGGRPNGQDRG
jgi:hypothetical protein